KNKPLRVLDLGTGTGSNLRYLVPRLSGPQEWLAIDRDAVVLADLIEAVRRSGLDVAVDTRQAQLSELPDDVFAGRHLVTASALLDLVSDDWLHRLAERCRAHGAVVLFALTYNGDSSCSPMEPEDDLVRELLNRHQRADKGCGVAAGPEAA